MQAGRARTRQRRRWARRPLFIGVEQRTVEVTSRQLPVGRRTLRHATAALLLVCALTFSATAQAVDFGANDDTGKYSQENAATFFTQMAETGLKQNVMTVR